MGKSSWKPYKPNMLSTNTHSQKSTILLVLSWLGQKSMHPLPILRYMQWLCTGGSILEELPTGTYRRLTKCNFISKKPLPHDDKDCVNERQRLIFWALKMSVTRLLLSHQTFSILIIYPYYKPQTSPLPPFSLLSPTFPTFQSYRSSPHSNLFLLPFPFLQPIFAPPPSTCQIPTLVFCPHPLPSLPILFPPHAIKPA